MQAGADSREGEVGFRPRPAPGPLRTGPRIARACLDAAARDPRIPFVTFLLPPSRNHVAALARLGAREVDGVEYGGAAFRKFRLDTPETRA